MSIQKGINSKVKMALKEVSPSCGDCSGFECEILIEGNKKVCAKLDKTKASKPCQQFIPNVKEVGNLGAAKLEALADLVRDMPDNALRAMGILFFNEARTRKQKMTVMQKVFVRYRGAGNRNYISNFMQAFVLYANPKHYKLISADGRCVLTYGENCRPVIHTEEEFAVMHAAMLRKGALVDPDTETLITRRFRCEEEYDLNLVDCTPTGAVSTIDDVFAGNSIRKARKAGLPNLIELVAEAAEGYSVDKPSNFVERDVKRDKGDKEKVKKGDVIVRVRGGGAK
jgi:hypothetical protein